MLKKYLPFLKANIMNTFIYRSSIWLWVFVEIFRVVMLIFLWISVYQNNTVINGFTLNDMIFYFLIISITSIFSQSHVQDMMSQEIREGKLSLYLTKPINYKKRLLFENLGRVLGSAILIAPIAFILTIITVFGLKIDLNIGLVEILSFLIYIPLIVLLIFEFSFLFGTLMIYTENDFGLIILMSVIVTALSGQLIPLALYPAGFLKIIQLLPFQYISYPPLLLLNKLETSQIIIGIISLAGWVVLFKFINFVVFKMSLKRMVIFGG